MTTEALPFVLLLVAAAFALGLTLGTVTFHVYVDDVEDDDEDSEG